MAERIERPPVDGALRFVVAGDSGAWADPTADGIFTDSAIAGRVIQAFDRDPANARRF